MSDPDSEFELVFGKIREARKAITDAVGAKRGFRSQMDCPICKAGQLHYSIDNNGHINAKCNSGNCVSWME